MSEREAVEVSGKVIASIAKAEGVDVRTLMRALAGVRVRGLAGARVTQAVERVRIATAAKAASEVEHVVQ